MKDKPFKKFCGPFFSVTLYANLVQGVAACVNTFCKDCPLKEKCSAYKVWLEFLQEGLNKLNKIVDLIKRLKVNER